MRLRIRFKDKTGPSGNLATVGSAAIDPQIRFLGN
jgi:hypothetical protein